MFRYLAVGDRDYLAHPSPVLRRRCWELEAVISGSVAPMLEHGRPDRLRRAWLWVFPPGHVHGWTGDGAPARIAVVQAVTVPDQVRQAAELAAQGGGSPGWGLPRADLTWFAAAVAALSSELAAPDDLTPLRHQRLLCELSLRAMQACPAAWRRQRTQRSAGDLATAAEAWFLEHLHESPRETELAAAIHVSPAHLRRLFHATYGESPRRHLNKLRLRRADDLLGGGDTPIAGIAKACGFSDPTAFTRAYTRFCGRPPSRFRTELAQASQLPTIEAD